ncbi:MAG: hypothetical protein HY452_01840 [Parcubacteria group bacterium]|uniref:Uncharacterized protein n=1 Tax=Candidatus Sungiibacteriota bacterium TaxID=2750080 RepID=A0A932DSJ2_9BACT|nr:hypothetical protein [Candidatus Sungbacteria bacterium]MBI4118981.1 hypothetical protein [Parcubacteria group bacterium]
MQETIKKIISVWVVVSLLAFYFVSPITVNKADAFLGIGDITFNTTLGDIPRFLVQTAEKILKYGLQKLKKRMLTQIQNDLVNWVQNGGEPRFIKDPVKFLKDNTKSTAARQIDEFFLSKNINICSPFKANVRFLVTKPLLLREEAVRCSLGDIVGNLQNFAENFENGGWTTWLKLHETRNSLPGSYLAAAELINTDISRAGNAATAQISAGKGFLDQKICRETKAPKYVLEFVTINDQILRSVALPDPVLVDQLLSETSREVSSWADIWPRLIMPVTNINYFNVLDASIELINTGEFRTTTYDPPIKNLPAGTTCSKEETITPGSIIGDQISGVLEKTGIDNIINANDIAQILDAVIDAAVNRAAREGLSYMKSGRGSYTQSSNPNTRAGGQTQQLPGLESPDAINLQNQMIDMRNAAQKLKSDIVKLTGEHNQNEFRTRLSQITGTFDEDGSLTNGIVNEDLRRRRDGDNALQKVIDSFFSDWRGKFGNSNDFNKEGNNPGVYLANQAINQKTGEVWHAIDRIFKLLSEESPYTGLTSCVKIDYTLEPRITEENIVFLPFFNTDGQSVGWVGDNNYVNNLRSVIGSDDSPRVSVQEFQSFASEQSNIADTKSTEYQHAADAYEALTQNSEGIIESLENDISFATSTLPEIYLYTSMLLDYDRAGRESNLVQKIKTYTNTLSSTKSGNDNALRDAYTDLRVAQRATRNLWLGTQQDLLVNGDADSQVKANIKINGLDPSNDKKGIEKAIELITISLDEVDNNREIDPRTGETIIDPTQLGLSVADAVAEAMNINKDAIRSEMEERQLKIGQQQTDISNKLGKFIDGKEQRMLAGSEGGDSEWEKYFKNRFQLVYTSFIYDFYANRFVNRFCNNQPVE